MSLQKITSTDILKELDFNFSRSSGPGGQSVNKVNTKVGLRFDVAGSTVLTAEQKEVILNKLGNKLTKEGVLVLSSQVARSQLANKELVMVKLDKLLENAFKVRIKRKPTKPTKGSVKKRLESKKHQAKKKANRQNPMDKWINL